MSARFGRERVKRGIVHFLAGKVLSALAGLGAVILIVRGLSVADFASYSVLVALVEVFTALTGLGLAHVVLRYVPELYATHRASSLRSVIFTTLGIRTAVLIVSLLLAYALSAPLAQWIKLGTALQAFELFLVVVALRTTSHFLAQILESALHQGVSQMAFSAAAVGRLLGMLWLLNQGHVDLIHVVALEALCDGVSCLILLGGLARVLAGDKADERSSEDAASWWLENRKGLGKFAASAYLQHLAIMPYGSNTNRLVGGVMFGDKLMASFGFAIALYEYVKRYLPTQLLIGLIRPVVVARFSLNRDFSAAGELCDRALHINLIVIFGAIAPLLVSGEEFMLLLTANKYGAESYVLLVAMLFLLALESQRLILELLTQTVEQYRLMISTNMFLSSSVALAIVGFPLLGAVAFPLANALAIVFANMRLARLLRQKGYQYVWHWQWPLASAGMLALAVVLGLLLKYLGAHWMASGVFSLALYGGLIYFNQRADVIRFVRELVGHKN